MITTELRRVPEGDIEYVPVAILTVADDNTFIVVDPEQRLPTDIGVLVVDDTHGVRRILLEDDPVTFARNLDTVLRTGYLVPVIVEDTHPGAAAQPDGLCP